MVAIICLFIKALARELTLFAAAGFLVGGIDDLLIDLAWGARGLWRRTIGERRLPSVTADALPPPQAPGRLAVFIAAWHESAVIEPMLRSALSRFDHGDFRIYVGAYPNDPETQKAVVRVCDPRVRLVIGDRPGPTSKAACLNAVWAAMVRDEKSSGVSFKAVVLHDAEDVVHPLELKLFDALIEQFDLVQLPVLPLPDRGSPWIAGHYLDEFAEAHGKQMIVRAALGASVPSAGVGCALERQALERMAAGGDGPFDEDSLTEDYELGLRLGAAGGRSAFVVIAAGPNRPPVAIRAYFPGTFDTAVRQKTRWMTGIALAGWDRLGWRGSMVERWMRLRDRRAVLAAMVLAAGYASCLLAPLAWLLPGTVTWPAWAGAVLAINGALLVWRLAMRMVIVTRIYGWREGLRSVPRLFVGNVVAMAAARRAVMRYRPGHALPWDKTAHHFPDTVPCD